MGNCIDHQRVSSWVDEEEWEGSPSREKKNSSSGSRKRQHEQQRASGHQHEGSSSSSTSTSVVVKLKLTKRQLKELLQRANERGAMDDARQMLEHAIDVGTISRDVDRPRRWAPRLQSINEVAEDDEGEQ